MKVIVDYLTYRFVSKDMTEEEAKRLLKDIEKAKNGKKNYKFIDRDNRSITFSPDATVEYWTE